MNIKTLAITRVDTGLAGIALTALAGLMLLLIAGFAQASVLHDGAHDTRHAIAFPCH
ncbi:MAG: CbtB domain-containing protein [Paracoccaceae bacterium]